MTNFESSIGFIYGLIAGLSDQEVQWLRQEYESLHSQALADYNLGKEKISSLYQIAVQDTLKRRGEKLKDVKPSLHNPDFNVYEFNLMLPGEEEMLFCYVPAASFVVGSLEGTHMLPLYLHQSQPFFISKQQVTKKQWQCIEKFGGVNFPASSGTANVSYNEIEQTLDRFNHQFNQHVRSETHTVLENGANFSLPTEEQWQLALGGLAQESAVQPGEENEFLVQGSRLKELMRNEWEGNYLMRS